MSDKLKEALSVESLALGGRRYRLAVADGDELQIVTGTHSQAVLHLDFRIVENIVEVQAFDTDGRNVSSFVIAPLDLGFGS